MDEKSEMAGTARANTIVAALTIVMAALLVAAFFLPCASATADYRAALGELSENPFGLANEELADIPLFECVRIYLNAAPESFAALYVPATVAPAVLSVLTLLFSALRKPVPVIVFSVLAIAMSMLLTWDFEDRGVIPSSSYDWGEARWVYLVAGIAAIAFAARAIALHRQVRKT